MSQYRITKQSAPSLARNRTINPMYIANAPGGDRGNSVAGRSLDDLPEFDLSDMAGPSEGMEPLHDVTLFEPNSADWREIRATFSESGNPDPGHLPNQMRQEAQQFQA